MLRRRLVRPGGDEQPGLADPVRLEFLDDDAIEEWAKVVAHFCAETYERGAGIVSSQVVAGEREARAGEAQVGERAVRRDVERDQRGRGLDPGAAERRARRR